MTKLGEHLSEEAKMKISESKKLNPTRFWLGKKRPDISEKISNANKGKHFSPKTEFKNGSVAPFKGRKHTEEAKQKLSIANKGKNLGNQHAKGVKHTDEWKKEASLRMKGNRFSVGRKPNITSFKKGEHRNIKTEFKEKDIRITGEHNFNWNDGSSFEPYSVDWTETLKRSIRERDKYTCQICGKEPATCVHHIDYDKKNCNPSNLVTLCTSCHSKTNHNRNEWIKFFKLERGVI